MLLPPRPVRADRRSVEHAALDLVEARLDEERDGSAAQSQVDRLACAQEARADGEVDLEVRDLRAEATRLGPPARRETRTVRAIAAHDPRDVRGTVRRYVGREVVERDTALTPDVPRQRGCARRARWCPRSTWGNGGAARGTCASSAAASRPPRHRPVGRLVQPSRFVDMTVPGDVPSRSAAACTAWAHRILAGAGTRRAAFAPGGRRLNESGRTHAAEVASVVRSARLGLSRSGTG